MNAPTRRAILAGAGVALVAGAGAAVAAVPPIAAANPDAELIATAAEAVRLAAEYSRLCWASDEQDPRHGAPEQAAAEIEFAAVDHAQDDVFARLADMMPTTPEGLRAKAEAVYAYYEGDPLDDDGLAGPALWSLITQLAGKGGAA